MSEPISQSRSMRMPASTLAEAPVLAPVAGLHSFHLRTDARQLIQSVFLAYGIEATVDQSVSATPVKLDLDDVTFKQAIHALSLVTDYVLGSAR